MKIEKRSQIEWLYLLYFIVMLAHSSIPYLKFVVWLAIIFLTVYLMRNGISRTKMQNIVTVLFSYGVFFCWVAVSRKWAYVQRPNAGILDAMVRILPIMVSIAFYIDSREKVNRMLDIVVVSTTYFAIVYLATSPISTYGTTSMRGITEQHRNFSAYLAAIAIIIAFNLFRQTRKRKYEFCISVCSLLVLFSGSRGALASLGVMIVLYALFQDSWSKRTKFILIGVLLAIIGFYLLMTNDFLYNMYGERILAIFSKRDQSAEDRSYYIELALEMFYQKPICGWGMDNFSYYLNAIGGYGREVYSHCNYAEILSCYGIIGFILFYWPYFRSIAKLWKKRRIDPLAKVIVIVLCRYIIFEYSTISFEHFMYMCILTICFCSSNVFVREEYRCNEEYCVLS